MAASVARRRANPGERSKLKDSQLTPAQRKERVRLRAVKADDSNPLYNPSATLSGHALKRAAEQIANAQRKWPDLRFAADVEETLRGAELVLVLTEWPEYVALDPVAVAGLVADRRVLDGRNCLDAEKWRAAGWTYRALGRR